MGRLALSATARQDAGHELLRRLRGEPALPPGPLGNVLVLCHGNICRSPFAAVLLAARAPALEVRSAGLHADDGNPADAAAARCAERMGISLAGHRSRRVDTELLEWAHLILVMQGSHVATLQHAWPQVGGRARLLGAFLPAPPYLLEDPWGQPEAVFDDVFARVKRAVENLVVRIAAASPAQARRAG
jgi:protein-tyrosine phosphatase